MLAGVAISTSAMEPGDDPVLKAGHTHRKSPRRLFGAQMQTCLTTCAGLDADEMKHPDFKDSFCVQRAVRAPCSNSSHPGRTALLLLVTWLRGGLSGRHAVSQMAGLGTAAPA